MIKFLLVFCILFDNVGHSQTQFTGIRLNTINIKYTKSGVSVSEMQNSIEFCGRFKPWGENIQSPFEKWRMFDFRNYITPEILHQYRH